MGQNSHIDVHIERGIYVCITSHQKEFRLLIRIFVVVKIDQK